MNRRTLAGPVVVAGRGVHGGRAARVTLRPRAFGEGLWLGGAPVSPARIVGAGGATTLSGPFRVVEHLLAAVTAAGITDLYVACDADELPILDGSAAPWLAALADVVEGPPVVPLRPGALRIEAAGGVAVVAPDDALDLAVVVDFGRALRGAARWRFGEPAPWIAARTFVLARDVDAALAAGRGQGADAENTVAYEDDGRARFGERFPGEGVAHKLLDLAGDLALVGPLAARIEVARGSHALHHALVRALVGLA